MCTVTFESVIGFCRLALISRYFQFTHESHGTSSAGIFATIAAGLHPQPTGAATVREVHPRDDH